MSNPLSRANYYAIAHQESMKVIKDNVLKSYEVVYSILRKKAFTGGVLGYNYEYPAGLKWVKVIRSPGNANIYINEHGQVCVTKGKITEVIPDDAARFNMWRLCKDTHEIVRIQKKVEARRKLQEAERVVSEARTKVTDRTKELETAKSSYDKALQELEEVKKDFKDV